MAKMINSSLLIFWLCYYQSLSNSFGHDVEVEREKNWLSVKQVLNKMAPKIHEYVVYITKPGNSNETLEFLNVSVTNWLEDIRMEHVTSYEYLKNNLGQLNNGKSYFKEKVVIANFTIPKIIVSGWFLQAGEYEMSLQLDEMAVGIFVHFYWDFVYVDNFQMLPPLLMDKNKDILGYKKLLIWLLTSRIIEDYLKKFRLSKV